MSEPAFVHLRVHSEYSLVDGTVRIPELVRATAEAGMPAVAVTDQSNLFAMVKFYRAAEKKGIKPLIGADLLIHDPAEETQPVRLALFCCNRQGYLNLSNLLTRAFTEGRRHGIPQVDREWLTGCTDGLIALSAAGEGDIGRALLGGREDEARALLDGWLALFGDRFYIELQRTGRSGEAEYLAAAVSLAAAFSVPVVASNDVRFLSREDFYSHEARVCIQDGFLLEDGRRPLRYSEQQYLRTPEEMTALFADIPEALENSVEIARRCNLALELGGNVLPAFPVPEGMDETAYLGEMASAGLKDRLGNETPPQEYLERLRIELDVIVRMGFSGYFLIVADFVRWARANGVPVGPGRGSGAGSLVAYTLGITDLDPLEHELLFERFLNPERVSMPDFDIDFCMEGRDRVIDYVAQRYGRDRVSQIITYGSMAARAVVRDVGRVLGHPYGFVDRIAKLIPMEIGMTLRRALTEDQELKQLYSDDEAVQATIDLALSLEGLARNAGKHAGGVVIAPSPLTDFTPLYCEDIGTSTVTQLDKDDVEAVGLVKFDFLGLRTLTIIDRAIRNVRSRHPDQADLKMAKLAMDDRATFSLLKRCETTAVFQLESRGMKDLIKRLQPDHFDEIVALVALFRPGPLQSGMVDDFIKRKHGEAAIDYPHPELEPILRPTYGVILYQEQVMQIAQVLAGYSLGGADLLRRAMGKKKASEMARQRSVFMEGAIAHGVEERQATHIFDLMEKFAGYGFNKSHSAAYAVLSYQTAWLKAHFPASFMAAVLSSDMDHTDKVVRLIDECVNMGLEVDGPDVNESGHVFEPAGARSIRYGLGAIKGAGQAAIESIIAEREANGPYLSLAQFCRRIDLQRANKRVLEALIRAGALDCIGPNRATLTARLPAAVRAADQASRDTAAGQDDLFGLATPTAEGADTPLDDGPELPEWSEPERLAGERQTLGLYLTGHPIEECADELAQVTNGRLSDLIAESPAPAARTFAAPRRTVTVAGLVVDLRRRGNRVSLELDDRSGRIEVTVFDEAWQKYRSIIARDAILIVEGGLRYDDFIDGWRVTANRIQDLDQLRQQFARRLDILWEAPGGPDLDYVEQLQEALRPYRGGTCAVQVCYRGNSGSARLTLGTIWQVRPAQEMLNRLRALPGTSRLRVVYPPRAEA